MKKILFIIGSKHEFSITRSIIEGIIEKMASKKLKYEYEIIHLKDYRVLECEGCRKCFIHGDCILSSQDDMNIIVEKIRNSEVVMWACPVYMANVTGTMKILIDRLSYFSHRMEFAGKLGFSMVTTSSSGAVFVSEYLQRIFPQMGFKMLGNFIFEYEFIKNNKSYIESICSLMASKLKLNYGFSDLRLESLYRSNKKRYNYKNYKEEYINFYEVRYWNQKWIMEIDSFQKFASSINSKVNLLSVD